MSCIEVLNLRWLLSIRLPALYYLPQYIAINSFCRKRFRRRTALMTAEVVLSVQRSVGLWEVAQSRRAAPCL